MYQEDAIHLDELRNDWRSLRKQIFLRDGGHRFYCDAPLTYGVNFTVDHVLPICQGGITDPTNLVAACPSCNSSKDSKPVLRWARKRGLDENLSERLKAIGWGE